MNAGEILLYQTEDGRSRIDVRLVNDTIWLSAGQMADLFQRDKSTISRHIQNVFEENELDRPATVAFFATVQTEGAREVTRDLEHFNLDFAELQARDRKPMYMADWLRKLDQFLQISEREILTHAGSISADAAREKAEAEYEQFRRLLDAQPSTADVHLRDAIEVTKRLETEVKSGKRRNKPSADQAGEEVGG